MKISKKKITGRTASQRAKRKARWPIKCPNCDGTVRMTKRSGRTRRFRNIDALPVPDDLAIPECDQCGETFMDAAVAARIDKAMHEIYQQDLKARAQAAIAAIIERGVTQQRVEQALGLSQGYLSKVRHGTTNVTPLLVSQLWRLSKSPSRQIRELERYWEHAAH